MIYMRGLKAKDLANIVDFIYFGEVNVYQEDLDVFLALADELQLKGLTENKAFDTEEELQQTPKLPRKELKANGMYQPRVEKLNKWDKDLTNSVVTSVVPVYNERKITVNSDTENLKAQIDTMFEGIGERAYRCSVCGKEKQGRNSTQDMRRHVETHIEGVVHPCNLCGKVSRSSIGLINHVARDHRK
jgi:hypothetical protein